MPVAKVATDGNQCQCERESRHGATGCRGCCVYFDLKSHTGMQAIAAIQRDLCTKGAEDTTYHERDGCMLVSSDMHSSFSSGCGGAHLMEEKEIIIK